MAQICRCGRTIPLGVEVDGKRRQLRGRRHCLICLPFRGLNNRNPAEVNARLTTNRAARFRRYQEKARRERKQALILLLGGKCSQCGYDRCVAALEFHHRDPNQKTFHLSADNLLRRWEIVVNEAQKCDLLCANCHRELEDALYVQIMTAVSELS